MRRARSDDIEREMGSARADKKGANKMTTWTDFGGGSVPQSVRTRTCVDCHFGLDRGPGNDSLSTHRQERRLGEGHQLCPGPLGTRACDDLANCPDTSRMQRIAPN